MMDIRWTWVQMRERLYIAMFHLENYSQDRIMVVKVLVAARVVVWLQGVEYFIPSHTPRAIRGDGKQSGSLRSHQQPLVLSGAYSKTVSAASENHVVVHALTISFPSSRNPSADSLGCGSPPKC